MSFAVFKYYFFLTEENQADSVIALAQFFEQRNFMAFAPDDKPVLDNIHQRYYLTREDRINILVVSLAHLQEDWDDNLKLLRNLEKETSMTEDLMFQVTVLHSSGVSQPWDDLLSKAQNYSPPGSVTDMPVQNGHLARLVTYWPHNQAWYLLDSPGFTPLHFRFLTDGLPRMEAGFFRLNLITGLFRDRVDTINKELQDFSQQLTSILHTQLVRDANYNEESQTNQEMVENQIRELSYNYGILATNADIINNDYLQLHSILDTVQKTVLSNKTLSPSHKLFAEEMLSPYHKCMDDLIHTIESLSLAQKNYQAAIEVVRSRIDIMLSRENIDTQEKIKHLLELNTTMQKQSLVFQVAAGIIEFVVLAYYSHSLWKNITQISGYIYPGVQFIITILFSAGTVFCTHQIAEYAQGEHYSKPKLYLSVMFLTILLSFIIIGTFMVSGQIK